MPGPDYFKDTDKPTKANWKKHEKDIARRSGDRQVAGSGNQPGRPGDVMGPRFIRDGKATKYKSIAVTSKQMKTLVQQGLDMGRIPVFEIRLETATPPVPTDWILLPAPDFQEIIEKAGLVN